MTSSNLVPRVSSFSRMVGRGGDPGYEVGLVGVTKSKTLGGKHSHKVFIIYSVRSSMLYKNCKTRNIINSSNTSLLVCSLIEFKNNYLRQYNSQLSRFVFYLSRHIPTNLSKLKISGKLHAFKRDVIPPKRTRGWEDAKYSREPNLGLRVCLPNGHGWVCAVMYGVPFPPKFNVPFYIVLCTIYATFCVCHFSLHSQFNFLHSTFNFDLCNIQVFAFDIQL